jgi:hypothetical protein
VSERRFPPPCKPLVFQDHTAGDEVAALCRLIVAQAEQHFVTPIANDQIDGDKRCQADHSVQVGMTQELGRHGKLPRANLLAFPGFGKQLFANAI